MPSRRPAYSTRRLRLCRALDPARWIPRLATALDVACQLAWVIPPRFATGPPARRLARLFHKPGYLATGLGGRADERLKFFVFTSAIPTSGGSRGWEG